VTADPQNFGLAFTVWAIVVAITGGLIVYELIRMRGALSSMAERLDKYILGMEHRVTHVESHLESKSRGFRRAAPRVE